MCQIRSRVVGMSKWGMPQGGASTIAFITVAGAYLPNLAL
jgi:hypothetical protein